MFKWVTGFLFGSTVAGLMTLLTTDKDGKERRDDLKKSVETVSHIKQATQHISDLQSVHLPQLKETVTDVKTTIDQFKVENQPRFRRIRERLTQLQTDLAHFNQLKK